MLCNDALQLLVLEYWAAYASARAEVFSEANYERSFKLPVANRGEEGLAVKVYKVNDFLSHRAISSVFRIKLIELLDVFSKLLWRNRLVLSAAKNATLQSKNEGKVGFTRVEPFD